MSINGINKFKVSTVPTPAQDNWKSETASASSAIEDMFNSPMAGGSGQAASSGDVLWDPYTGYETTNNSFAGLDDAGQWLTEFPPTLEQVIFQNERALEYLDIVERRYVTAIEDLSQLKRTYEVALNSGSLSSQESQELASKMPLVNSALAKANLELEKCRNMATDRAADFINELRLCKDLLNNGWIGRPYAPGSIKIHEINGRVFYTDHEGRPVHLPVVDPDYQAKVTTNDSLAVLPSGTISYAPPGAIDLILGVRAAAIANSSNEFGCPIEINIPRYFWVKRDPQGTMGVPYAMDFDVDNTDYKMELYNSWNGTTQETPPDLSQYMQVRVAGVDIESVELPWSEEGYENNKVYDHVVVFKDGEGNTIARFLITGHSTDDTSLPFATPLSNNINYVAPSSLGLAIKADNLHVELDASRMRSTGRHIYENLAQRLGISAASGDIAERSFNENIEFFTKKDWYAEHWKVDVDEENETASGDWVESNGPAFNEGSHAYGSYSDRYLAESVRPVSGHNYDTFHTGIYATGIRGDITGSMYNDVIETFSVHDISDSERDRLAPEELNRDPTHPLYANRVNSGKGNNIVVAGRGDNFIEGATFVWLKETSQRCNNFVNFPSPDHHKPGRESDGSMVQNQKCYFWVEGRSTCYVYNPDESSDTLYSSLKADEMEAVADEIDKGLVSDDYYGGQGTIHFGNPEDENLEKIGVKVANTKDDAFTREALTMAYEDRKEELLNAIRGTLDPDFSGYDIDWDDIMGAKSAMDDEMNSFFDEMFSGMSGLFDNTHPFMGDHDFI